MTIALWCLLVGGLLPLIWVGIAKRSAPFGLEENKDPRAFLAKLEGRGARANAAQHNAFEAFPLFAAAVLIAHYLNAAQGTVDLLAGLWLLFRFGHGIAYVIDQGVLRSLMWTGALVCTIGLFVVAA